MAEAESASRGVVASFLWWAHKRNSRSRRCCACLVIDENATCSASDVDDERHCSLDDQKIGPPASEKIRPVVLRGDRQFASTAPVSLKVN